MALPGTVYHDDLVDPDLHTNKIDPTTNTELTPASLAILDTRYSGTTTPDATTSVKGKVQLAGDLAGTAAAPTVKSRTATKTVGFANADYICDGTADNVEIQAAIDAVNAAGGGTVFLREGTYNLSAGLGGATAGQYSNITIRGAGRNATILKAASAISVIAFGSGNATPGNIWRNLAFADFTIDMNNKLSPTYGMALGICQDVLIDNVHIKNQKNGALSMLFWGAASGASSAMLPRNLTVRNCVFSDSDAQWEAVTLAQGINAKFVNCTFRDKTAIFAFLNYGTHDVTMEGCHFENCGNAVNGFGATKFVGCDFFNANLTVQSYNTTVLGCSFESDGGASSGAGIKILGYVQSAGESFWDALPPLSNVSVKNTKILGCSFKKCNSNAIVASTFTDGSSVKHLSADDLEIADCSFENTYWQGIDVKANYLTLRNLTAYNSGQLGTATVAYNFVFAAKRGFIIGLRSYDDQGTPTTTRDFFIDDQLSASAIPTQDLTFRDNTFAVGGVPYYYNGSAFTSTKPSGVTLRGSHNSNINLDYLSSQGNVTGATTFDRKNGSVIAATLTGNITITLASGQMSGDLLSLILTQDATGSRTATWPTNAKFGAGGTLTLSTAANAVDVVTFAWDGTNWREVSRSLAAAPTTGVTDHTLLTNIGTNTHAQIDTHIAAANPHSGSQPLDATLTSLAAHNTNGLLTQTAADTFSGRTITGTANQVNVSNGNGVSGNPTLSLPQSIDTGATPTFKTATLTVPSAGNAIPLSINQNDTTNNPRALVISNTGTGISLDVQNSGNGPGAQIINNTGTTGGGNNVLGYYAGSTSATTGGAFNMIWNSASFTGVAGYGVMNARQLNASASGNNLVVEQAGTGRGIYVIQSGNGVAEYIKNTGTQNSLQIEGTTTTDLVVQKSGNVGVGATPTSPLQVAGAIATAYANKTAAYTLTATDSVITADATGAAFQITLPTAVGISGRQYTIKRTNSGANNVTVGSTSSQTLDGATTKTLGAQFSAITVISDGAGWQIVNQIGTVT